MENLYKVNNSKGVIGLISGLKSRITSTKPLLTLMLMLMVGFFGVNESAWGQTYKEGQWWSLYDAHPYSASTTDVSGVTIHSYSVFTPNAGTFSFVSKLPGDNKSGKQSSNSDPRDYGVEDYQINFGGKTVDVSQNVSSKSERSGSGSWLNPYKYTFIYTYNYRHVDGSGLDNNLTSIEAKYIYKLANAWFRTVYIDSVKVPLKPHILLSGGTNGEGLSTDSKAFGEVSIETASEAQTVSFRSFLTDGDISISLNEGGDPEVFRLGTADNTSGSVTISKDGYSYGVDANACASANGAENAEAGGGTLGDISKYSFNVYFRPKAATDYEGTITITDGTSTATVTLSGTGVKLQPEVTWSSNDEIFNVDDVLSATNSNGLTVTLSGNSTYVTCSGNTATMKAVTSDNITITAHVTGNDLYADRDITKEIKITNLEKQTISWTQDFSRLKTTDKTKSITLNATSSSGLDVSYALVGDKTGLSLNHSGSTWTLTYSADECKNTTIVASQSGNSTYAPASSVSLPVKVIDPTKVCDASETLVNSTVTLKDESTSYNIDIPATMTIQVSRTKTSWAIYSNSFKVEIYGGRNGTGSKLHEYSYGASDINTSKTISLSDLNVAAKSVKLISEASNGYNVTSVTYTKQKYCTISESSLAFETYPNTTPSAKTFNVNYANYPISIECDNDKFTISPTEFGDCSEYGTQPISVTYSAGADEGNDSGVISVKDNTGVTLQTCSLSVKITRLAQSITSTSIQSSYNTTERIELSAESNSKLTDFTYSATPEGVASFDGNVMTFSKSGIIDIKVTQPGSNVYAATSSTVKGVQVNTVTPNIATNPSVSEIKYLDNLTNGEGKQLSGGLATVTLRGVADSEVEGTFSWTNPEQVMYVGSHDYSVTFTPADGGMYNPITFTQSVTVSRADGGIEMNNGEVLVKVSGINDDLNECKIDLDGLVQSKIKDDIEASRAGVVSYKVISENKAKAAIDGENKFSATQVGTYTIRATQAQTFYYKADSTEFTVTVNKLTPTIVFDNTDDPQIIYSGDSIGEPAVRMYNGKIIDRKINYVSSDIAIYVGQTEDLNKYPYLKARDVVAEEGTAVAVIITASWKEDDLYNKPANSTHNYAVRAKRSPVFTMDTYVNKNASKTLNIGEQAIITYNENTNEYLTVGTSAEHSYVSISHDKENSRITITAVKGSLAGDGEQEIMVHQPGNARLFDRSITYTFTVKKNVSALSLAGLTGTMGVEDTVATPYTGLANTSDAVNFSCSPEGSMKYEDGKLIALQAGTNTVTFSQSATEYWTGVSVSKTITVSKKDPNITTELQNRHAWYSIIEHPFSSLNTEKALSISSSKESLAKYIAAEDKIYVYGTSGEVTFTVNQDANYKYNAVENYQKKFTIFQPNNRLPFTLTSGNLEDYNGGGAGSISWNGGGVVVGSTSTLAGPGGWEAKSIILKFVGVPDKLSFDFANTSSIATQYGWHFYESSNGSDWNLIKEYQDALTNASGGTSSGSESNLQLDPATQYIKLEYHGNYGGRYKNVHVTERKEITPRDATKDFGLGYNGNAPTMRAITVDWYNVKPCTVTITGTDADKFVLDEGSKTINSQLDHYGTVDLKVSYKHENNSETTHTATLHIEDEDGNSADVTLTGQTTPAPQTIIWRNDLTPMPIEGSFQNAAMVSTGQTVTLVSDHPEVVRVVNNTTLEPVSAGTARVTATAAGNTKWAETTDYMDIEVTTLKVQYITWTDNLSNRKREEGQTVNITLTATSSAGLPITYELDEDAQAFASISGNVLSLTGWGSGQVIAKQVGNEEYVAVQASKSLVSRNPNAKCRPLVGEYKDEYTLHTLAVKEIPIYGEPDSVTFWAKCDLTALWGMWVAEEYNGAFHDIQEISRTGKPNITSDYQYYSFPLHRNATAVKLYTKTGATMTRTFKNVEIPLAKYLELAENTMNFSQVDKGSTKTQSFYINYSNLSGVLDVEMENKENTQFTVVTTTVGEDCGDIAQNVRIEISCTGSTLGTENNTIIVHNADQRLEIPVSATVVLPSQAITWDPEVNVKTTDEVQLEATATSELEVTFTSMDTDIAEPYRKNDGTWWLNIHSYGEPRIVAHQPGDGVNWGAATDKTVTFYISRVEPVVTTWPTAQIILPNTVGGATLIGGESPEGIPGTFHWEDESLEVTRQAHTFNVVFEPTNSGYYAPVSNPLEIEILKTPQTITWTRADESEAGCSDVVILDATASSGLPITYHSSDSTIAYAENGKLKVLKYGDVTITAEQLGDDTYAAAPSVSKTITLNRVMPTIETLPIATFMYVHHFLSNSTPQGGVVKASGNQIYGNFIWEDDTELMDDPGINHRTVVFHPYNSGYYLEVSAVIDVDVRRFAPTIVHNFTTDTKVYGFPLSDFTLHGSGTAYDHTDPARPEIDGKFAWKNADYIPSVSEKYAIMMFYPDSTRWYDNVEVKVPIQLTRALVGATATAHIFYGQVLEEAELVNTTQGIVNGAIGVVSGILTWHESLDLMEYYTVGTHELPIRFTSTDNNYEADNIEGTAILTVGNGYVFDGHGDGDKKKWDKNDNWKEDKSPVGEEKVVVLADVEITDKVVVEAMTIKEGVTVIVKDGGQLTVGNFNSYVRNTYGNLYVEKGGRVNLGSGKLKVQDFTMESKLGDADNVGGKSGQVSNPNSLDIRGEAYFDLALDPSGECSSGWYDFTVPFPVDASRGVTRFTNDTKEEQVIAIEKNYAIMDFEESRRLGTGHGWKKFHGIMQPGKAYSIAVDRKSNIYRFKKTKGSAFNTELSSNELGYTIDLPVQYRGWNGLGNGTMEYVNLSATGIEKVQLYSHEGNSYSAVGIDDFTYVVGASFFIQAPDAESVVTYAHNGTTNTLRASERLTSNGEFMLSLSQEDADKTDDRLYVSAIEDAIDEYEIGRDLTKFGTPTEAKVAQVWAEAYGLKLCDVEQPLVDNKASITLGLFAPQAGRYTLSVDRAQEDATLYLTYNNRVIWNLSIAPYVFDLTQGTTEGFGLRLVNAPKVSTDFENADVEGQTVRKVMIDNIIYLVTPDGKMYDIMGKGVKY